MLRSLGAYSALLQGLATRTPYFRRSFMLPAQDKVLINNTDNRNISTLYVRYFQHKTDYGLFGR
jgi:hypothetical protein